MNDQGLNVTTPGPATDWISRRELARLLGISHQTAYKFDKSGKFRMFEHNSTVGGQRRRFSRSLVQRYVNRRLQEAAEYQDEVLADPDYLVG